MSALPCSATSGLGSAVGGRRHARAEAGAQHHRRVQRAGHPRASLPPPHRSRVFAPARRAGSAGRTTPPAAPAPARAGCGRDIPRCAEYAGDTAACRPAAAAAPRAPAGACCAGRRSRHRPPRTPRGRRPARAWRSRRSSRRTARASSSSGTVDARILQQRHEIEGEVLVERILEIDDADPGDALALGQPDQVGRVVVAQEPAAGQRQQAVEHGRPQRARTRRARLAARARP